MMYEHLQKWGPRKQEVKFFLRHEDSPTESSDQGTYWPGLLWLLLCSLFLKERGGLSRKLSGKSWNLFWMAAQLPKLVSVGVSLSPLSYPGISSLLDLGVFAVLLSCFWCTSHAKKMDTPKKLFSINFLKLDKNQTMCGLGFLFEPSCKSTDTL